MAAETNDSQIKFVIGEDEYEMPDFLDLDLDEWALVYDVSGVVLEDFSPIIENKRLGITRQAAAKAETERLQKLRHPNVLKAFACVGYRRANTDADPAEIEEIVGRVKMLPFLESMVDEDDAETPTSASAPDRSSLRSADGSSESSSAVSQPSSDEPDGQLAPTGTGG